MNLLFAGNAQELDTPIPMSTLSTT